MIVGNSVFSKSTIRLISSLLPFPPRVLPALQVDGPRIVPTPLEVAREIAEKYGLAGRDNVEAARAIRIVVWCLDFMEKSNRTGRRWGKNATFYPENVYIFQRCCRSILRRMLARRRR